MGQPFASKIKNPNGDVVSNTSDNRAFSDIMQHQVSRRSLFKGGAVLAGSMMLPSAFGNYAYAADAPARATRLGFQSIAASTAEFIAHCMAIMACGCALWRCLLKL